MRNLLFCVLCVLLWLNQSVSEKEIILASASPRRRELLIEMGVRFEVMTSNVPELDAESSPASGPRRFGPGKCEAQGASGGGFASGALDSRRGIRWWLWKKRILGKPASIDQARDFLRALSGRTHEVITGCALIAPKGEVEIFHEISRVTFHLLTDETIGRYLAEVAVLDKAGGYALQEQGEWIVERVEGSRANVIGLPTEALERVLLRHGLL